MPWLFIVVTAAIWLLVKLSKPGYEQVVEIKLAAQEVPLAASIPSDTVFVFSVTLKGRGFDLIAAKRRLRNIEGLPLGTLLGSQINNTWYVSREQVTDFFQRALPRSVTVAEVEPPTFSIRAKQTAKKRVAVVAQLSLETAPGYRVTKYDLIPDSVTLQGDAATLENWDSALSNSFSATDLRDSLTAVLDLQNPHPAKVTIEPARVQLAAQVELWTEVQVRVPINVVMPYGKTLSPAEVSLRVNVPARMQNRVVADEFLFTLAPQVSGSAEVFRPVQLERQPHWAEVLDWQPKRAAVIETQQP